MQTKFSFRIVVVGQLRGLKPLVLENTPKETGDSYPSYEVITVNGVTDIVEHRQMEPVFYMTDDARVWKALGVPYTKQRRRGSE